MKMFTLRGSLIAIALAAPLSTSAFAGHIKQGVQRAQGRQMPVYAAVSDAQIAGILRACNEQAIKFNEVALQKAQNAEVKAFAQEAVKNHQTLAQEFTKLLEQEKIKIEDSEAVATLQAQAQKDLTELNSAAQDFDQTYVRLATERHENELKMFDDTLVPSAQNAQLKAFLQSLRSKIEQKIEVLEKLQQAVGGEPRSETEEPRSGTDEPSFGH